MRKRIFGVVALAICLFVGVAAAQSRGRRGANEIFLKPGMSAPIMPLERVVVRCVEDDDLEECRFVRAVRSGFIFFDVFIGSDHVAQANTLEEALKKIEMIRNQNLCR